MSKIHRLAWLLLFMTAALVAGCGGGDSKSTPAKTFTVPVFSDIHFNPYYDTSLFDKLVLADYSQWAGVFESSTVTGLSTWGDDTN